MIRFLILSLIFVTLVTAQVPSAVGGSGSGGSPGGTCAPPTSPNGSITIGGSSDCTAITMDFSTSYGNGLFAQIAASNTFSAGATQIFVPSATKEGIRIGSGSLPSAPGAGALAFNAGAAGGFFDGTEWHNFITMQGTASAFPSSLTSNQIALADNSGGALYDIKFTPYTWPTTIAAHQVVIATSTTVTTAKTLIDCPDTGGNHYNYTQSTDAFSCGTSSSFSPTTTGSGSTYMLNNAPSMASNPGPSHSYTAGVGGTTVNLLVKLDTSAPSKVILPNTSNEFSPIVGVAVSTVSANAAVEINDVIGSLMSCVAETGGVISGHVITIGTSNAGRCLDSGQTNDTAINANVQIVGDAETTASAGSTFSLRFRPRFGLNVGGQTGTAVYGAGGSGNTVFTLARNGTSVHQTAQTAAITTATLCSSAGGNNTCGGAGMYHLHFDFLNTGTACSSVGPAVIGFQLTWTDSNATAHNVVTIPMVTNVSNTALAPSFIPTVSALTAYASGDFTFSTNGSIVQYATTYTACTTGTLTYQLDAAVTRIF